MASARPVFSSPRERSSERRASRTSAWRTSASLPLRRAGQRGACVDSWLAVLPALLRRRRLELVLPVSGALPRVARARSSTSPKRVPEQELRQEQELRAGTTGAATACGTAGAATACGTVGAVAIAGRAGATTGLDGGTTGTAGATGATEAASGALTTIGGAESCLTVGTSPHTPHVVAGSRISRSHCVHRVIHTFPENTGVRSRGGKGRTGRRAAQVHCHRRSA